jgi:hypothetical protein
MGEFLATFQICMLLDIIAFRIITDSPYGKDLKIETMDSLSLHNFAIDFLLKNILLKFSLIHFQLKPCLIFIFFIFYFIIILKVVIRLSWMALYLIKIIRFHILIGFFFLFLTLYHDITLHNWTDALRVIWDMSSEWFSTRLAWAIY